MSNEPVKSPKAPHPVAIAAFMLGGAVFGEMFDPVITGVTHNSVERHRAAIDNQLICTVGGALGGLALERLIRRHRR